MNKKVVSIATSVTLMGILMVTNPSALYAKGKDGKGEKVLYNQELDTPFYIGGKWEAPEGLDQKEAVYAFLDEKKDLFKMSGDMKESFRITREYRDKETDTYHFRLVETYNDIPVYGSDQVIAMDEENTILSFFGQVIPKLDKEKIQTKEKIKKNDAVKAVKKDLEKTVGEINQFIEEPSAELYIYPFKGEYHLAYLVKASFVEPQPGYWHYFVDATNGKVIHKLNAMDELTGTGVGVLGDTKSFEITQQGSTYYMYGTGRGVTISTHDAKNVPYYSWRLPGSNVSSSTTTFSDRSAVDAHGYAEAVYDYFKNTHGRNSYDGNGANIISSVHVGRKWNNAAWIGTQMVYGDGDGTTFIPLSGGLDVVGHELTHAVTESTANLIYQDESGALNESLSDIFGAMMDRDDWLIGEDIYTPNISGDALRSMEDPASLGDPDHYSKRYTGTQDNGGVHTNSSINNKAAYLLSEGGTHYGVTVNGIGRSATEKIYYRALTMYLTSSATFSQMRQAAIQAATDLYGAGSAEVQSVQKAYDAVGVY